MSLALSVASESSIYSANKQTILKYNFGIHSITLNNPTRKEEIPVYNIILIEEEERINERFYTQHGHLQKEAKSQCHDKPQSITSFTSELPHGSTTNDFELRKTLTNQARAG